MRKILLAIVGAIVLVFALSGCAQHVKGEVKPEIVQQNLLKKCTKDTPLPENPALDANGKVLVDSDGNALYNGKEMMRVLIAWDGIYTECATTHDALVDTINKIQSTTDIKAK